MTNLTDKWKKGELPEGKYYMENTSGIIGMVGHSKVFPCYNVKQILAPVPTFEEWQASEKYNKHLEEVIKIYERKDKQATETSIAYNELLEENNKLKTENKWYSEQLNEAVKKIDKLKEQLKEVLRHELSLKEISELTRKICQALGEDNFKEYL